jgi:YD repeat-containing protein
VYKDSTGATVQGAPISMLTGISECRTMAGSSCVGTADETKTTITCDVNSNLASISKTVAASDNSVSSTISATYDTVGNKITETNAIGGVTYFRYDSAPQLIGIIKSDQDSSGHTRYLATRLAYNPDGFLTSTDHGTVTETADADWANFSTLYSSVNTYDTMDRPVTESQTSGGSKFSFTQNSYDQLGRPLCRAIRMASPDQPSR